MGVPNMRSVKLPFVSLKSKLNRMYFSNIIWKRGAKRGFTPCLEYLTNYSKHLRFFKNICTMYMYNNYKLSRINVTFLTLIFWVIFTWISNYADTRKKCTAFKNHLIEKKTTQNDLCYSFKTILQLIFLKTFHLKMHI